jgi:hypothetical protein
MVAERLEHCMVVMRVGDEAVWGDDHEIGAYARDGPALLVPTWESRATWQIMPDALSQ